METGSSSTWSCALAGGDVTIVAPATPAGRGALAVVRLSGTGAHRASAAFCRGLDTEDERRAQLVAVLGADGEALDTAVAIPYRRPRSFTGEDLVELVVHGSPVVVEGVVAAAVAAGCRPAEPGEFTRRAVANGKLDLVQAEAVRDLVEADTVRQARAALRQQSGELSARFESLRRRVVELSATLEAAIDFAEHGVGHDEPEARARAAGCVAEIDRLLATAEIGRRLRDGVTVVLAGPPNAGKSTLFNRLVGGERAIVSARPGTTRDVLEARVEIEGVPVRLLDTAGLHDTEDEVDAEGVRRARAAAADADGVVLLWAADAAGPPPGWDEGARRGWIRVRSKCDLGEAVGERGVSAMTGAGVEELRRAIATATGIGRGGTDPAIGERHRRLLAAAREELAGAPMEAPEVAAGAVRQAARALEELVGRVDDEAVLDEVFRRFCIGK